MSRASSSRATDSDRRCIELLHHFVQTNGTNAVSQLQIGMRGQIGIDLFPVIRLVSHLLAVAANGQQALQRSHFAECCLELGDAGRETPLKAHHPFPNANAGLELHRVERLRDVVVRTSGEAVRQILLVSARRKKNDVHALEAGRRPQAATDIDSLEARHHPVEHGQLRRVASLHGFEDLPCGVAVFRGDYVPAETLQSDGENLPRHRIIFSYQNFHYCRLLPDDSRIAECVTATEERSRLHQPIPAQHLRGVDQRSYPYNGNFTSTWFPL